MNVQSQPLVSVVIPAYNAAAYIVEALRSVLNQTYPNLEIIVVDDCSTDRTFSICEELARSDSRLRVLRNESNMKISASLNRAIQASTGKYIARMDGDDICLPHRIETQLAFLEAHSEFSLVGSAVEVIDQNGVSLSVQKMPAFPKCMRALPFGSTTPHPTWFARREFFTTVGEYRISGVEDYDYLLRASALGLKFSNMSEVLLKYRVSNSNSSHQYGLKQVRLVSYVKALNRRPIFGGPHRGNVQVDAEYRNPSRLSNFLYDISLGFFDRAYCAESVLVKAVNYLAAAAVSPYAALRLYRSLAWKFATR